MTVVFVSKEEFEASLARARGKHDPGCVCQAEMRFDEFLRAHLDIDNAIGDLARDVRSDRRLTRRLTPDRLRSRMRERHAEQAALDTLDRAERLWLKVTAPR